MGVNNNATAKAALVSDIKAAVLAQNAGYVESDVKVTLSRGSVKALVSITPKAGSYALYALKASMSSGKHAMAAAVLVSVKAMAASDTTLLESGKTVDDLTVTMSNP